MTDESMTTVRILGQRPSALPHPHPTPIPADAEIYNGPDTLWGTFVDGMSLTWLGDPIAASGSVYAAILPNDPRAGDWREENLAAGAIRLEYVTVDQVREALRAHYADELGMDADEIETMMGGSDEATLWRQHVDAGLHLDRVPA